MTSQSRLQSPARVVVSVILPVFNRLKYLRSAVESVFAQSFQNWELIIADDGSDEETQIYLRSLAERAAKVRLIWLQHSGNPAAVRNAALRLATGAYVAFLDSDDLWAPNKLERQIASLSSRSDCRWGYTGYDYIDADGRAFRHADLQDWVPHKGKVLDTVVALKLMSALPSVIVERELLERVGAFDEQQRFYEDHDLWLRLALQSEADVVAEKLLSIRRHSAHYCGTDFIASAVDRGEFLQKMSTALDDKRLQSVARRHRVLNAIALARLYADAPTSRHRVLTTLWGSYGYSWSYLSWWLGALNALLRLTFARRRLIADDRYAAGHLKHE